jgi:O-antigen ligase
MYKRISRILIFAAVMTVNEQYAKLLWIGSLTVTPKKIMTFALLGLGALKFAIRPHRMPRNGKNLAVLGFALAGIPTYGMSYLMGVPPADVAIATISFFSLILFYFLVAYMVEDERDLEIVLWAVMIGAALIGLTALSGVGLVVEGHYTRSGGYGRNPNLAATYSVTGFTVGLLLFMERPRSGLRRVLVFILLAVTLFGILATLSRTGLMSLIAVSAFLMVRSGRLDLLRWGLPIMVLAAVAFIFLTPEQYYERISTTGDEAQDLVGLDLTNHRIRGWWAGLNAFAASPLVGVGRASYLIWMERNIPDIGAITPHNSYLHVLTTMGLFGFLPWMTAIVLNWRDFSRVRRWARMFSSRKDPVLSRLSHRALFLQAAFLVWLTASLVSPFADDEGLWLLLALGTVVAQLGRERALALAAEEPAPEAASAFYPLGATPPGRLRPAQGS